MRVPAVAVIAVTFAAGILAAEYMALGAQAAVFALLVLAAVLICRRPRRGTAVALCVVFAVGCGRHSVGREIRSDNICIDFKELRALMGTITSEPDALPGKVRFVLSADAARRKGDWRRASGKVMVSVYEQEGQKMPQVQYGDRMIVTCRPYQPMQPSNPGQLNWNAYLARKGIPLCASVRRPEQIAITGRGNGSPVLRAALSAKALVIDRIRQTHPPKEASVVVGMVLGTYAYLPPDTLENFRRTGTLHVLAASGFNCVVLLMLANPVLKMLQVRRSARNLVIIVLLVLYLLMVGLQPSLLRATVMASLVLAAPVLRRVSSPLNLLFTAALVILAIDPACLFDVGFQLSFLGVLALSSISPVLKTMLESALRPTKPSSRYGDVFARFLRKLSRELAATAVATAAVSLVTAPVLAYHFNSISLVSLPANVTMALGVPLVFADGVLSAVIAPVPVIGQALGTAGSYLADLLIEIVDYFGSLRFSAYSVASPGIAAIVGYYTALYSAFAYARTRH